MQQLKEIPDASHTFSLLRTLLADGSRRESSTTAWTSKGQCAVMSSPEWEQFVEGGAFVAVVGTGWAMLARDGVRRSVNELQSGMRSRRAERAAVEATLEDVAFDPALIRASVSDILQTAETYWRQWGRRRSVPSRPDGAAIVGWLDGHRLAGAIHLDGQPRIDLLRVVNRDGESDDRVEVRVRARLELDVRQQWVDAHTIHIDDRWTLGRQGPRWVLLDGRSDRFAQPVLTRPLIPAAWADDQRMREQALTELANQTIGTSPAGLTASSADARNRLLDLAVVDDRFSPALIDATVRHVLDAWEQETLDHAGRLEPLATPSAQHQLLATADQDPRLRFAIRDIELTGWEPIALDAERIPPGVTARVSIKATRFVIDERNAVIAGNSTIRHTIELRWTLELADHAAVLWQLADSHSISGML